MAAEVLNIMAENVSERDKQELTLGDTLDIKTSVILVALIFLATQTAELLHSSPLLQSFSIVSVIFGAVLTLLELWPRDYDLEPTPKKYSEWLRKLKAWCADESDPESEFLARMIVPTQERIETNHAINKDKSWFMMMAFGCTVISFALNLGTLATHLS